MTLFIGEKPYTVQPVAINSIEVLRKLAAHLGIGGKLVNSIAEFEVVKDTLSGWVLGKLNRPQWYDEAFFLNLVQLDVDRYSFYCPPIEVDGTGWEDLPSGTVF